jgi:hypothetical protein
MVFNYYELIFKVVCNFTMCDTNFSPYLQYIGVRMHPVHTFWGRNSVPTSFITNNTRTSCTYNTKCWILRMVFNNCYITLPCHVVGNTQRFQVC